ncbi:hypothetical protein B0H16DRAFT_1729391 [Mycena metata]|uniref:Uncharacterized protein n=1 Tax=Mycena metata TaxID=1033252 RepID=A0AAD7IBX1_9AGAR|nr:hypothetical protein B0H16DRAFT_1729391 [Mycena metata]
MKFSSWSCYHSQDKTGSLRTAPCSPQAPSFLRLRVRTTKTCAASASSLVLLLLCKTNTVTHSATLICRCVPAVLPALHDPTLPPAFRLLLSQLHLHRYLPLYDEDGCAGRPRLTSLRLATSSQNARPSYLAPLSLIKRIERIERAIHPAPSSSPSMTGARRADASHLRQGALSHGLRWAGGRILSSLSSVSIRPARNASGTGTGTGTHRVYDVGEPEAVIPGLDVVTQIFR